MGEGNRGGWWMVCGFVGTVCFFFKGRWGRKKFLRGPWFGTWSHDIFSKGMPGCQKHIHVICLLNWELVRAPLNNLDTPNQNIYIIYIYNVFRCFHTGTYPCI